MDAGSRWYVGRKQFVSFLKIFGFPKRNKKDQFFLYFQGISLITNNGRPWSSSMCTPASNIFLGEQRPEKKQVAVLTGPDNSVLSPLHLTKQGRKMPSRKQKSSSTTAGCPMLGCCSILQRSRKKAGFSKTFPFPATWRWSPTVASVQPCPVIISNPASEGLQHIRGDRWQRKGREVLLLGYSLCFPRLRVTQGWLCSCKRGIFNFMSLQWSGARVRIYSCMCWWGFFGCCLFFYLLFKKILLRQARNIRSKLPNFCQGHCAWVNETEMSQGVKLRAKPEHCKNHWKFSSLVYINNYLNHFPDKC